MCTPQGGSQHTLSECLVSLPLAISRENLFHASTMGALPDDVRLNSACFGSQQDFLARGVTSFHMHFVPLYHRSKNISFPLIAIVAILRCCLLQCTGVLGWGCPSSSRVSRKIIPSLQLRKRAPSLASAAEATTNRRMVHNVKNAPFNLIGSPSLGDHPMKKWPHMRLCAFVSKR